MLVDRLPEETEAPSGAARPAVAACPGPDPSFLSGSGSVGSL